MRRSVALAVVLAALAAAPLVLAANGRVALRGLEGNPTDAYSPSLAVATLSPPEYRRGCCYDRNGGEWVGPRYEATGRPSLGGNSTVDWSVGVAVKQGATRAALLANLVHDWPIESEGRQQVRHRVGGRAAGSIAGHWVLTRSPSSGADDARYEAAVGFPLCDGSTGYARFSLLLPSGDSAGGAAGYGEYVINGTRPTEWNRTKAMESLRAITVEGNRPVRRVTARRSRQSIAGKVVDCSSHPVAAQPVELQRRAGSRWTSVGRGRTRADGSYLLPARTAGTYRVTAAGRTSNGISIR